MRDCSLDLPSAILLDDLRWMPVGTQNMKSKPNFVCSNQPGLIINLQRNSHFPFPNSEFTKSFTEQGFHMYFPVEMKKVDNRISPS